MHVLCIVSHLAINAGVMVCAGNRQVAGLTPGARRQPQLERGRGVIHQSWGQGCSPAKPYKKKSWLRPWCKPQLLPGSRVPGPVSRRRKSVSQPMWSGGPAVRLDAELVSRLRRQGTLSCQRDPLARQMDSLVFGRAPIAVGGVTC